MEKDKLQLLELMIDDVNNVPPKVKLVFDYQVFTHQHDKIEKCFFIYFWLFGYPKIQFMNNEPKHKEQIDRFCKMLELIYYIYYNKYVNLRVNKNIYTVVEKIFDSGLEYEMCKFLFNKVKESINEFEDKIFISIVLYLCTMLKTMKFKTHKNVQTNKKELLNRIRDILLNKLKLNINPKYIIESTFKYVVRVDVYSWINGRFENGVQNIFQNCIPRNFGVDNLYKLIKKMKKEI